MRTLFGCTAMLVCFLTASAGWADEKIDVKKLVGKWEPSDAKKDVKVVLEFTKDGKLSVTADAAGEQVIVSGSWKLDGNKLTLEMKSGENEIKDTVTIKKLTDNVLEAESDSKKRLEKFKRVKP